MHKPVQVNQRSNLHVIEVDPSNEKGIDTSFYSNDDPLHKLKNAITGLIGEEDIFSLLPGVDETAAIIQVLEYANNSEFSRLVFDTAPTGHTLRLLQLPLVISKTIKRIMLWLHSSGMETIKGLGNMISPEMASKIDSIVDKVKELDQNLDNLVSILKDPVIIFQTFLLKIFFLFHLSLSILNFYNKLQFVQNIFTYLIQQKLFFINF